MSKNGRTRLWDVETGTLIRTFKACSDQVIVTEVGLSYDGTTALFRSKDTKDNIVYWWDVKTETLINKTKKGGLFYLYVEFNPKGESALTASAMQLIYLWNTRTGKLIRQLKGDYTPDVTSLVFSPNGQWILTRSNEGAYLWDAHTGTLMREFKEFGSIESVAFSPNSQSIVLTGIEGKIYRVNLVHCEAVGCTVPHCNAVNWISKKASPFQVYCIDLISKQKRATGECILYENTLPYELFCRLPEDVRDYLINCYSIEIEKEESNCLIQ